MMEMNSLMDSYLPFWNTTSIFEFFKMQLIQFELMGVIFYLGLMKQHQQHVDAIFILDVLCDYFCL